MNKIMAAISALRYGSSLADPAVHKNRQNLINALIGVLGATAVFIPIEVSADEVATIAGGIATVVGLLNVYFTVATTDKIGMHTKDDPPSPRMQILDGEMYGQSNEWKSPNH